MLFDLLSSNALRILITALAGGVLYLLARRLPIAISAIGFATSALLAASLLLDIGEVYNYSSYYKRAFWYFGDDVTTWLGPLFVWAVLSRQRILGVALAMGILFSGTKISMGVIAVELAALWLFGIASRKWLAFNVGKAFGMAGIIYLVFVAVSPGVIAIANSAGASIAVEGGAGFERSNRGSSVCAGLGCLYSHLQRPIEDRFYSSIGGLWMAWNGDFAGDKFPNSKVRFADLMMEANPWGINDRFGITHQRWLRIGGVQTPYLQFGAGYGIVLMSVILLAIGVVSVVGVRNIMDGEREPFVAFTLFFLANAVVNITQPWLNPGPVLLLMGFCGTHILFWRLQHIQIQRRGPALALRCADQ